jgi:hypothetical protein
MTPPHDPAQVREDDIDIQNVEITDSELAGALEAYEGDTSTDDTDSGVAQSEGLTKKKTSKQQIATLLAAIERGLSCREAASQAGIHLRTAYGVLARYEVDLGALQAATQKILAIEALDRVDDWRTAARVGAAKRGNHLPAKDWLLHAGIIEPLQGENQGHIRIAINIGTEERPMKIVSPIEQTTED